MCSKNENIRRKQEKESERRMCKIQGIIEQIDS